MPKPLSKNEYNGSFPEQQFSAEHPFAAEYAPSRNGKLRHKQLSWGTALKYAALAASVAAAVLLVRLHVFCTVTGLGYTDAEITAQIFTTANYGGDGEIGYQLLDSAGDTVASGSFQTRRRELSFSALQPGSDYRLIFTAVDSDGKTFSAGSCVFTTLARSRGSQQGGVGGLGYDPQPYPLSESEQNGLLSQPPQLSVLPPQSSGYSQPAPTPVTYTDITVNSSGITFNSDFGVTYAANITANDATGVWFESLLDGAPVTTFDRTQTAALLSGGVYSLNSLNFDNVAPGNHTFALRVNYTLGGNSRSRVLQASLQTSGVDITGALTVDIDSSPGNALVSLGGALDETGGTLAAAPDIVIKLYQTGQQTPYATYDTVNSSAAYSYNAVAKTFLLTGYSLPLTSGDWHFVVTLRYEWTPSGSGESIPGIIELETDVTLP